VYYLSRVGLFAWQDAYPRELSGGMLQRLALARTVAMRPDLVLLDEPLGALDALTRRELQVLLADLHRSEGSTFVMVTHDVDEALAVSSRLIVLGPAGSGIIYDSERSEESLDREGLVALLSRTQFTFAAGPWSGYSALAQARTASALGLKILMGLNDEERLRALRDRQADAAFFTVQALSAVEQQLQEMGAAVVHAFARPTSAASCEYVLRGPRSARGARNAIWAAHERSADLAIIERLDPGAVSDRVRWFPTRAACVEAVGRRFADACLTDRGVARSILGWITFLRSTLEPLPEAIWSDLWIIVVALDCAPSCRRGGLLRAVHALWNEINAIRWAGGKPVEFLSVDQSLTVLSDGTLSRLLENWGSAGLRVNPSLLRAAGPEADA
jgi:hypothetical protein